MADITLRPLLSHAPEVDPPRNPRVLLIPAMLALLGMLIALAATVSGQDERRAREFRQRDFDYYYWDAELRSAQLEIATIRLRLRALEQDHIEPSALQDRLAARMAALEARLPKLQKDVDKFAELRTRPIISYARYGRQFTPWDGYRYEEIVEQGYIFHKPNAPQAEKDDPLIDAPNERRSKNVVWYPLYPMLAWVVSHTLHISANLALTIVSWVSCLLAAVVMFLFAQRHYFNRMPALDLGKEGALALEAHPSRRWDLTPQDTAALWAIAALLFGPCSIFLYANFTESLFVLLLAAFLYCVQGRWWWRAAAVAALASACRSQGVLFGPILFLIYLLRSDERDNYKKLTVGVLLGFISAIGLMAYMIFLWRQFGDPLAFMYGQKYWNVGLSLARVQYALNPINAMTRVMFHGFFNGPIDWPRLWEALCLIWPPIMLLILGGRYLSFELEIVGWMLWGLPFVSNSMAGNPPMDTQWMSMGRFMAVMIPAHIILGAVVLRLRWLGVAFLVPWATAFAIFCFKYGNGAWVG